MGRILHYSLLPCPMYKNFTVKKVLARNPGFGPSILGTFGTGLWDVTGY